ncbi:predicted protein, partial [Nematostella vectensis]
LKFNAEKCEILTITGKHAPVFLNKLNTNSLKHVNKVKDLGITVTSDLKWESHIRNLTAKGFRTLGFLRRHCLDTSSENHKRTLYLKFVRPYVGYASEIWAPEN